MTVSTLYIAWRVKDIYEAIPGEPITVMIEPKKEVKGVLMLDLAAMLPEVYRRILS